MYKLHCIDKNLVVTEKIMKNFVFIGFFLSYVCCFVFFFTGARLTNMHIVMRTFLMIRTRNGAIKVFLSVEQIL